MTRRVLLFGNSGSGKTTMARRLVNEFGVAHLDLDSIAWEGSTPPQRRCLDASIRDIDAFIGTHDGWVIEGCYADLLGHAARAATEMIWLKLSIEDCMANARSRPWESHKYPSKAAQDANLPMLLDWISEYETRTDEFSAGAHEQLYERFCGKKSLRTDREGT
ncbi:MAG: AAA family ATPase [Pseudomonadota bacterium]